MLKRSTLAVTFGIITTLSLSSHANEYQQMMDGMLQFQHCITETMAANYMETMAASSEKMSDEITRLCSAGKRDQAQKFSFRLL